MTKNEFLNQFNVLYNNTTSNQAPNLNEYEISVFLTKGEYEVLKNYFNPKSNKLGEGFDDSPKRHVDFSSLTKEITLTSNFVLPTDLLFPLEETVTEKDSKGKYTGTLIVVPLSYHEYQRLKSKPYGYPLKRQAWRILNNGQQFQLIVHPGMSVNSYKLRYIKKPNPIILYNAEEYIDNNELLTIDGYPKVGTGSYVYPEINIPEELHQEVLQRAVELAKIAWLGDLNATLTGGQRSE